MTKIESVLGQRSSIDGYLGGFPLGDKQAVTKEIREKYGESVSKIILLFEYETLARGYFVKTPTRLLFCLTQDMAEFANTFEVKWTLDNVKGSSLDVKPRGESEIDVGPSKTLVFDPTLISSERLCEEIRSSLSSLGETDESHGDDPLDYREIQRKILNCLFEYNRRQPGGWLEKSELISCVGVNQLGGVEQELIHLRQEGCIDKLHVDGPTSYRIESKGIKRIRGNDFGEPLEPSASSSHPSITVINSPHAQVGDNNIQTNVIEDSFNRIYERLEEQDIDNKTEVKQQVKIIEEELKSETPRTQKIHDAIQFIKKAVPWALPLLTEILKKKLGLG